MRSRAPCPELLAPRCISAGASARPCAPLSCRLGLSVLPPTTRALPPCRYQLWAWVVHHLNSAPGKTHRHIVWNWRLIQNIIVREEQLRKVPQYRCLAAMATTRLQCWWITWGSATVGRHVGSHTLQCTNVHACRANMPMCVQRCLTTSLCAVLCDAKLLMKDFFHVCVKRSKQY